MSKIVKFWKTLAAGGAGVAALAAVNAAIARKVEEPEPNQLEGEPDWYEWKYGKVFYTTAGESNRPPILMVHGIGVSSSSYMWRRNFEFLSKYYRLYALDLLGFGFSDKPATAPYSADLYVELISDFIKEVVEQPANLVSSSLSAAFAIRVADEYRDQVKRMVLISPVTSDRMTSRPGISGAAFYGLLHSPVLGKSFYNTMVSEKSIRDFALDEMYYDRRFVTSKLVSNLYSMSHQPGAEYAVTAYLSGYLNTETRQAFSRLLQPVTLVWGKQDKNNPIENAAELLQLNPQASLVILDRCRMMPQEEAEGEFNKAVMQTFTDQEETVQTRAV